MGAEMKEHAATRLPDVPYPGLRPFLDHEAALLFGRTRQVREVIERMQQTHFVAVIGGSGSGKSSLIRAGVVPELRSFGIAGAGDFWIPVVCTPGTNPARGALPAHADSPVKRLAWKFAKLLRSRGSAHADTQRLEEIAGVFRQEAGFARLMDSYAEELATPPGLAAADARLLFVVDQFEELFHPSNEGSEDCRLLIERVIDHFFNPHPRCFVVLTMRSEHLNDCTGYLELPDAINKSSYLVRRLDQNELREAIVAPAQRFLRLLARQSEGGAKLPEAVQFEQRLLDRLLHDVQAITQDSDHLPLLQHLLARLWDAACQREAAKTPAHVVWDDLRHAVLPNRAAPAELEDKVNTLRAALENWAQSLYGQYPEAQRVHIDAVLRQLALKDPNTGQYTQQRINVDDCAAILGGGCTRDSLRSLIGDRFIGSVDYLFWDDENPARVTLKVSHESFIRGWTHLRKLIDREAERFEEFVVVFRKCASWSNSKDNPRDLLLEKGDFRRIQDAQLESIFGNKQERAAWLGLLRRDRDGARLAEFEPKIDRFLRESRGRVESLGKQRRYTYGVLAAVGIALLVLLIPTIFYVVIEKPSIEAAEKFFDAAEMAGPAPIESNYPRVGAAASTLQTLSEAAENVHEGRSGLKLTWMKHLGGLDVVRRRERFVLKLAGQSEQVVNGQLRRILSEALWEADPARRPPAKPKAPQMISMDCFGPPRALKGNLLLESARLEDTLQRGILVTDADPEFKDEIVLRGATFDRAATRKCRHGSRLFSAPKSLNPSILLDAEARFFLYTIELSSGGWAPVTLVQVNWGASEDGGLVARTAQMTVLLDEQAAEKLSNAVGPPRVETTRGWREPGGGGMHIAGSNWRVVVASAQKLEIKPGELSDKMSPADTDSPCGRLGANLRGKNKVQEGFGLKMYEGAGHCFAITRGNPLAAPEQRNEVKGENPGAALDAKSQNVVVAVYQVPGSGDFGQPDYAPAPIASLPEFGTFETHQDAWYIGQKDRYEGWIIVQSMRQQDTRAFGMPWSTSALVRLGNELLAHNTPKPQQPSQTSAASR